MVDNDMFDTLSSRLTDAFGRLGNKGRITEKDVDAALREVRMALLEADVNFRVAKDLVAAIKVRTLGADVLKSITPGQQVVKITHEELTAVLGGGVRKLEPGPTRPAKILMVGLNGSGKTTTSAKLARNLKQSGQQPMLVAADLARPAAIEQLKTLGEQIDVPVFDAGTKSSPVNVARDGVKEASRIGAAWVIVDTAGRFQVDDELMDELRRVKDKVKPDETLLVVDAMTGQEAVNVAETFNERIGLTGLVLTKLDGDARGGAALSITAVTGVPIKYVGNGERTDALDLFHPDRLASRILGMGDVVTLVEKAQASFDVDEAKKLEKKMRQATFDLEDFLGQLQSLRNMGPLSQVMDMLPGMGSLKGKMAGADLDEAHIGKIEAIIRSMTPGERRRPETINGSRRRRIAAGSGTAPQDINQLLNQFRQTQKLMKQMASGKGIKNLAQLMR
jgi:signal recognition particle subunit SRP54